MPLIKILILINNKRVINAIFDSGANISIIDFQLANELQILNFSDNQITTFNTINNESHCLGLVNIPIKIGEITLISEFYVLQNSRYNILIGLNLIKNFKLKMSENLRIYQVISENGSTSEIEVQSNYQNKKSRNSEAKAINFILENNIHSEENLTPNQLKELENILNEFINIFSKDKYDIGCIGTELCEIHLSNNIPINLRPYRCSASDQKMIDDQIKCLFDKKLIRKSISPYAFPLTLANKKDEGKRTRLCTDLRKLNDCVIPDSFPFPLFSEIIDQLYDCEYFTTLDITSGFWNVKIHPKDIHKTAFVTINEHYEWLVMPFGFKNSPQIFQRIIQTILKKHELFAYSRNYLDDILIYSRTFSEHLNHINKVLIALKSENIKLKMSKCKFARKSVEYLGHFITKNKFTPINDNLIAIREFPKPQKQKNVQQFLGKVNYYHKFIPNACKILTPLYNLLKKNETFHWSESCQKSFEQIKEYLINRPILAIYNPNKMCYLYTDASREGIGAVLKQIQNNNELHPIAYFSRKLLSYQQNYDITELECLALCQSIDYWHHYLYGCKFTVFSDHNALRWLRSVKKPNSRLFNWSLKLSQYDFDLKHIQGKKNAEADCLSRNPVLDASDNSTHIKIVNLIEKDQILEAQKQFFNDLPKNCKIENDLIVKIKNNFHKIFIPENMINEIIEKTHRDFGHIGLKKMLTLISSSYYFKNITEKLNEFLAKCSVCQMNKINRRKKLGTLSQIGPAKNPFEIISIDTVGGLSGYNSKKQYIHLAIDNFSRYLWTLASKTQTAKDFINLIKNVSQNSKPKLILADRYPGINSNEFTNYLEKNNIKIMFITVNCPQSNGLCERVNQTIITRLRCKLNENNQNICWPKLLLNVNEEYNNTPHSVTQFSPKYLLYGIKPFENLINGSEVSLEKAREIAFINSENNHKLNKKYYDRRHIPENFEKGDLVYVENKNAISRRKLEPLMTGPFKIIDKLSDVSYLVECDKKGKNADIFHISKLRLYNP